MAADTWLAFDRSGSGDAITFIMASAFKTNTRSTVCSSRPYRDEEMQADELNGTPRMKVHMTIAIRTRFVGPIRA
jgi:hypothetical protein